MYLSNDISRHGYSNAKQADATLDSFDNTGAAAKSANPLPVKPTCPGCNMNRFVNAVPGLDGVTQHCSNLNCRIDYFVPVKAEPVKVSGASANQMYQSMVNTFDKCLSICERKSQDYARGENPYRNFETVTRIGVSVQQGILIRTLDKITRLENLLTVAPYVTEETFEDTIDDAINYLAILKARREFERGSK